MAHYCDTQQLERYWLAWIYAVQNPGLEPYRQVGILHTQIGEPEHPIRRHILTTANVLHFITSRGSPQGVDDSEILLPLDVPHEEQLGIFGKLEHIEKIDGYLHELPITNAWHRLLSEIKKICDGISLTFCSFDIDRREELSNEALLQVASKLRRGKLTYQPGRAPVFNLLTTTVRRCMLTVLSKTSKHNANMQRLFDKLSVGTLPEHQATRTLKIGT